MGIIKQLFTRRGHHGANQPSPLLAHYQQAIARRYARDNDAWAPHLDRCRQLILEFTTTHRVNRLLVLGSGWLHDLHTERLLEEGVALILADAHHPQPVRDRYGHHPRITLRTEDLTGGILPWLEEHPAKPTHRNLGTDPLQELQGAIEKGTFCPLLSRLLEAQRTEGGSRVGVVSLNLLSQLAEPIAARYEGHLTPAGQGGITAALQRAHLAALRSLALPTLLISDTQELHFHQSERFQNPQTPQDYRNPLLCIPTVFCPRPPAQWGWPWHLDTQGYYSPGRAVILRVEAFTLQAKG